MELQTRSEEVSRTASVAEFLFLVGAVQKLIYGRTEDNVRVLLLEEIHYSATAPDPQVLTPRPLAWPMTGNARCAPSTCASSTRRQSSPVPSCI